MKKIIAGSSSPGLAKNLSDEINVPVADVTTKRFPDGECYARINENIDEAIIVQNTYPDSNIIELFLLQDAARKTGAEKISLVIPYYGYGRQDKTFEGGEAVSAEKMARLLEQDADTVILITPHKEHITNFFSIDARNCDGMPALAEYFKGKVDTVIAPDKGALSMAKNASEIIGCDYNHFEKTRISSNDVRMEIKDMDVKGKKLLILDDIISTGGTMAKAVEILKQQEVKEVYAACIHGLFVKNADERIMRAGCDRLIATDTIESRYSKASVAKEVAKLFR
ncbi:MAG: ribose-phosphate diphosphokinase [Candidatus Thermoplasmatota archaeon]|nr:ribose-phosphate diphosphokinase [Candidatus Thermoplasmatota archaeon]